MKPIINQIQKSKKKRQLICICLHSIVWSKRLIGYVTYIHPPDSFELQIIGEDGRRKSKKLVLFKWVMSLEVGGVYNDSLEQLANNEFFKMKRSPMYYWAKRGNIYETLHKLKSSQTVCTLFFKTELATGIIKSLTKETVGLTNLSFFGENDGISYFKVDAITKIRTGTNVELRVQFLREKS